MAKASDNLYPYVHLVPAAAPASPSAGSQRIYLDSGDSNKLKRKDSSGTVTTIEGGGGGGTFTAYTTYTPTLTATTTNPSLGSGVDVLHEGRYCQVGTGSGSQVSGRGCIQFGTSPSSGSGSYRVLLPVAAATSGTTFTVIGTASVYNASGGGIKVGVLTLVDSTHAKVLITAAVPNHELGASVPGSWADADSISFEFAYEAA